MIEAPIAPQQQHFEYMDPRPRRESFATTTTTLKLPTNIRTTMTTNNDQNMSSQSINGAGGVGTLQQKPPQQRFVINRNPVSLAKVIIEPPPGHVRLATAVAATSAPITVLPTQSMPVKRMTYHHAPSQGGQKTLRDLISQPSTLLQASRQTSLLPPRQFYRQTSQMQHAVKTNRQFAPRHKRPQHSDQIFTTPRPTFNVTPSWVQREIQRQLQPVQHSRSDQMLNRPGGNVPRQYDQQQYQQPQQTNLPRSCFPRKRVATTTSPPTQENEENRQRQQQQQQEAVPLKRSKLSPPPPQLEPFDYHETEQPPPPPRVNSDGSLPDLVRMIGGYEMRVIRSKDASMRVFPC